MAFDIFNKTVTGTRKTGGAYVEGDWVPSPPVPLVLRTSVQPSPKKDLELLPEGRRESAAYSLFSKTEIQNGDIVVLFGENYEVLAVEIWQNGILPHYKGVAAKMQKEGSL